MVTENKPGVGGNIAADFVAHSPADGYTLLVAGQAILAINKPLYRKLGYDPEADFRWVGIMGSLPNVLVTNPDALPARNPQGADRAGARQAWLGFVRLERRRFTVASDRRADGFRRQSANAARSLPGGESADD